MAIKTGGSDAVPDAPHTGDCRNRSADCALSRSTTAALQPLQQLEIARSLACALLVANRMMNTVKIAGWLTAAAISINPLLANADVHDEVTNSGGSIYLHVRAHASIQGHVVRSVLELESDSVRWGVCGALAWVGYDAQGHIVQYNSRAQTFCISGKDPGGAYNEQQQRVEVVDERVSSVRVFALWGGAVDRIDEVDWDQVFESVKQAAAFIGVAAGF